MCDQVNHLWRQKIPSAFINSDLSPQARERFYVYLQENSIKLAYMTPERFFTARAEERAALAKLRPAFLIIDEAHCIDRWGAAFRPEYGRLVEIRALLGSPPVLAFTATAGKEMQGRIMHSLGIEKSKIFVHDVDRPNIALIRIRADAAERGAKITQLLHLPAMRGKKLMIFVPTLKIGKMLREELANNGFDIPFYHARAGTAFDRQELLQRFKGESRPKLDWIICTKAFGMGLDIADMRVVIHWQQSASAEDYLQEYGRAGRDGKQAIAIVFYGAGGTSVNARHDDIGLLYYMAAIMAEESMKQRLQAIEREYGEIAEQQKQDCAAAKDRIKQAECENIDILGAMIKADSCFRRAISVYFKTDMPQAVKPKSLLSKFSWWLINRVYAEKTPIIKSAFCCDFCEKIKLGAPTDEIFYVEKLLSATEKINKK